MADEELRNFLAAGDFSVPAGFRDSEFAVRNLFGAVAQLGERLHGMQEVVGSTPIGSILRPYRCEGEVAARALIRAVPARRDEEAVAGELRVSSSE